MVAGNTGKTKGECLSRSNPFLIVTATWCQFGSNRNRWAP